jgi:hypothetical protein
MTSEDVTLLLSLKGSFRRSNIKIDVSGNNHFTYTPGLSYNKIQK